MSRFPTYASRKDQWVVTHDREGNQIDEFLQGNNLMIMMGLGFPEETVMMPFLLNDKIFYLLEDQVEKTSGGTGLPPYISVKSEILF